MSGLLAQSQERLEQHFADLSKSRGGQGTVFALEHGLEPAEWSELAEALRAALRVSAPRQEHWLLWVIYAAEHGYTFDGEEFWQSFESDTPYWRIWGDRHQVRSWFQKFKRLYSGVEPTGAWAGHFTIICWPITHAILPRDLQYQFARACHQARHRLLSAATTDPTTLGRLIKREAWYASSRFQQFTQHEELVGRLVLAILGADVAEGGKIILPATLKRIVADLEEARQAKEWLDIARRTVTRFTGTGSGTAQSGAQGSKTPPKSRPPSVRPTLILRRGQSRVWDVAVDIPPLADLAREAEGLREFLLSSRSTVNGGDGVWTPSSWLLGSGREKLLKTWPEPDTPILRFEQSNGALEALLRSEGALTQGPTWLCRIRDDGTAVEVLGRQVRPGAKYVVLHRGEVPADWPLLSECEVACGGISAHLLTLPRSLSATDESHIAELSLSLCRTIRIWPVGLAARKWDGEGSGEWLTTERPCFAIQGDHELTQLTVSLNNDLVVTVPVRRSGETVFVSLDPLPVGEHILRVRAAAGVGTQAPVEGVVALTVREPTVWVPGTTAHGGMAIVSDPGEPTLDDVLNNRLGVSIQGPPGRTVEVSLRPLVPLSDVPLFRRSLKLPAQLSQWSSLLGETGEEEIAVSSRAELVIRGEELGLFRVELERQAQPIRWAVRRHPTPLIRLIDESGADGPPNIAHAPFSYPMEFADQSADCFREGLALAPPGGLYWVHREGSADAVIASVPPQGTQHGFAALGISPSLRQGTPRPRVVDVLSASTIWRNARAVGALAPTRKVQVVQYLDNVVSSLMCGLEWSRAEVQLQATPMTEAALQRLGEQLGGSYEAKGFSAVIRRATADLAQGDAETQTEWFLDLAKRYKICPDGTVARDAFRIAADPLQAFGARGDELENDLSRAAEFPLLLRGARLANLVLAQRAVA